MFRRKDDRYGSNIEAVWMLPPVRSFGRYAIWLSALDVDAKDDTRIGLFYTVTVGYRIDHFHVRVLYQWHTRNEASSTCRLSLLGRGNVRVHIKNALKNVGIDCRHRTLRHLIRDSRRRIPGDPS